MNRRYSRSHEWLEIAADGSARIGISSFAADEIGEVAHLALPQPGEPIAAGAVLAEIESVKSVNEILAPAGGIVSRINSALYDDPTALNRDPEGEAWLVELSDATPAEDLLETMAYRTLVEAG